MRHPCSHRADSSRRADSFRRADSSRRADGFTLIELMIVVAIVAVLTAVAIVAYTRHLKSGRVVEGYNLIARVQAQQEAYFAGNGTYCNASGKAGGALVASDFHPQLIAGSEPQPKDWGVSTPAGWTQLGFRFDRQQIYFGLAIVAGTKANSYGLDTPATDYGLTALRPWYYVVARADLDGTSTDWTEIWVTSDKRQAMIKDQGK